MTEIKKLSKHYISLFFLTIIFLMSLVTIKTFAYENKKHILIINSYHNGYKWTDDIVSGIGSILNTNSLDIESDVEYMDTLRTSGQEYTTQLLEIYKYKYSDKKLDAIICCDDTAYNFVLDHQNDIFPNIPIVFCGVNYFDSAQISGNNMITGIIENYDIEANLNLILKLHPNTKNIYVINDNTLTGQAINKRLNDIIPKYSDKLDFINLKDSKQSDILQILNNPLDNSVALFFIFFQDLAGNKFNYDESPKIMSKNSSIPIYGNWEFSLGHGIVGGMLTSGYYQGKTAAELTLRILNGEAPSNIPIVDKNTNSYMFDYLEMKRFGINQLELPSNSNIINRPFNDKKQILVLNSYDSNMKWSKDIVNGINNILDGKNYELYIDYMDTNKNYSEEYMEKIEDLLKYKYRDKKFDIIIASDNDAYNFMKKYRNKLFHSIPLVFCGLNYYSGNEIQDSNTSGVIENVDMQKTLDLALNQIPNTKHIIIINDTTATGKANKESIQSILPNFAGKVDFTFYEDMTMSEIQQKVSALNNDTIIYLLSFNRDKSNNIFSYEESAELISSKSNVPIYGAWDVNLNHGIVGGYLENGESQGKAAGEIVKRVLSGEDISKIPIIKEISNQYMFDYEQLKKFNINLNTLPKESIIINQPKSFSLNKTTLVFILILVILIAILLFILNYKNLYKLRKDKTTIKELETTASTDFLTGTFNRIAGFKELEKLVALSNKDKTCFSLCFIDLNNLKTVNDNFGHTEGDNYIKTAIKLIQKGLNNKQILFRFGGDEFIIIFPNTTYAETSKIFKTINNYFDEYNFSDNNSKYEISISYGFSEYNPNSPLNIEELINLADKEMYIFKHKYKMEKANYYR